MSSTSSPSSDLSVNMDQGVELKIKNGDDNSPSPSVNRSYDKWSPMEDGATLVWRDLSVYAGNKGKHPEFKTIISSVTGAIKPGSLVALMGSSGAGKSTLMAALAHRTPGGMVVDGEILVNGRPVGDYMKHLSGFMHQEDLFVGSLTVWEHMSFMARMKLDRRTTKFDREEKILEILKDLGLSHRLHTRIGYGGGKKVLSGGEKKRLAFATELLTDPQILFCDEPTTGLDSFSAQKLIASLNILAAKGKTIICTIHQPSSQIFSMFSQIILLSEGHIAFIGSTIRAMDFFDSLGYKCPNNYNPADFLVRTLALTPGFLETSKQTVKKICNHFLVSEYANEIDVLVRYEFHMGSAAEHSNYFLRKDFKEIFLWTKFSLLFHRFFLNILRNPSIQILRIIQKMAIAVMAGFCFFGESSLTQNGIQTVQGVLAISVCENSFPAMYSVLAEFPLTIPLFLREYKSGMYNPMTFYAAKVAAMLPGLIVEPILFMLVIYWLAGLKNSLYSFAMSALSATLVMNVSCSCGIFFSNAFKSVPTAMLWLIPFDYVLMITSGFFLNLGSLGYYITWIKYFSWLMYGMESMSILQWEGVQNITCENSDQNLPCIQEGTQVLERYSFNENHLYVDLAAMFAMCLVFYALGFLCLQRKINKK